MNVNLRLSTNHIGKSSEFVQYKRLQKGVTCSVIADGVPINVGKTVERSYGNYKYEITLNNIGAAGKNPFTKAAYITVATYTNN